MVELGRLIVATVPAARVVVDGRAIGATPVRMSLTPGKHRVALVALDSDAVLQRRTVTIDAGKTTRLSVQLPDRPAPTASAAVVTGKLVLEVPDDVELVIDGKAVGRGARALELPVGEHTVVASKLMPDGRTWSKTSRVALEEARALIVQVTPPEQ